MSAYSNEILGEDGLVAYFRLGESSGTSAVDAKSANNGTYFNTPTLGVASLLTNDADTAVTFTGSSSQYVSVPTSSAYTFGLGDFTLEFWFKTSSSTFSFIIDGPRNLDNSAFEAWWDGNVLQSRLAATGTSVESASGLNDGNRHHAVIAMDRDGNGQWWVDGATSGVPLDISGSSTSNLSAVANIYFARWGAGNYFTGTLDEISIYNLLLGTQQIISHYKIGSDTAVSGSRNQSVIIR